MTLAAAREDQFLVEQDLHEAAAPMGGCYKIAIMMSRGEP
jgi:hypothetical protein